MGHTCEACAFEAHRLNPMHPTPLSHPANPVEHVRSPTIKGPCCRAVLLDGRPPPVLTHTGLNWRHVGNGAVLLGRGMEEEPSRHLFNMKEILVLF